VHFFHLALQSGTRIVVVITASLTMMRVVSIGGILQAYGVSGCRLLPLDR
jgi:hypothetical protein